MIYFPTNWGAKEPQNLPNHRVGLAYPLLRLISCVHIINIRYPAAELLQKKQGIGA